MSEKTEDPLKWDKLATYLAEQSRKICASNACTEDEHNCESYAYITRDGLLDICVSDYFQGTSKPHAAIPMPWTGTGVDLWEAVDEQCAEMDEESGVEK